MRCHMIAVGESSTTRIFLRFIAAAGTESWSPNAFSVARSIVAVTLFFVLSAGQYFLPWLVMLRDDVGRRVCGRRQHDQHRLTRFPLAMDQFTSPRNREPRDGKRGQTRRR